ncbi:hypothetical protein [Kibdelosporangium aridum]|uniref:hypothetical protein n=1 Tax=Kibdelosporangium aridum TaxID=2030 RepID=UPI0005259447
MTIQDVHVDAPRTVSPQREPAADPEGQAGTMTNWRDGRIVLRRPEARNSAIAKCYIEQTPEQAETLKQVLTESVERRRNLSEQDRAAQLEQLAALAAKVDPSAAGLRGEQ